MKGILRLVDNEPFTRLALKTGDDGDYLLTVDDVAPFIERRNGLVLPETD